MIFYLYKKMKIKTNFSSEKTWDIIAESFDKTRRKPWIQCIDFINKLPKNHIVADIGCGNGRHLIPCAKHCGKIIGIDLSNKLLKIVQKNIKKNKIENSILIHSNILNIPLKSESIDSALFIATLHNIKGRKNRIESLKEIHRILKNNGKVIISVWSRWQDNYRMQFFKKWFNLLKKNEFGDINIYWRQHGLNIPRFYHLYSKKEFLNDIKKNKFEILELKGVKFHSKINPDNYFAILRKK